MLPFIVLSGVFVVLVHWFLIRPYGYWKKRRVPGPEPTFFVGNMGLQKQNLGQIYQTIYNDYKNCLYVGYYKFSTPAIILRDIDLIKNVLIKDFASFHDNDLIIDSSVDTLFGRNPFCLTGKRWKHVRNLVSSGITTSKVRNMFYLMSNVCNNLITYLEKQGPSEDGFEAKDLAGKFTTDVVATCAFGLEAGCLKEEESDFYRMGKKFFSPSFWTGIKHFFMFILPGLTKLLKVKFMPNDVEKWFINVVYDTVKYREENSINRQDYLDMLIGLKAESGSTFTQMDVAAQALTFYVDGFETSALTLSHILYELAANPDVQEKLRKEIDTVLTKHKGEITYDSVQEMNYLDNVLQGLKFGLAQTKAAIITILSNYEISVNPKTIQPLQMDPQYFLNNSIGGLWLDFNKRKN